MSSLIEHAQRFEVVQLEAIFNEEPKCESSGHSHPGPADVHGGSATHFQKGPCPHANGLRCSPHVKKVSQTGAYCSRCRLSLPPELLSFVEL